MPHQDDWSLLNGMFRAVDAGEVSAWIFRPRNGHFPVVTNLGYYFTLQFMALDLSALRLFNFPICLAAFLLTLRVILRHVRSDAMRAYQALGAACLIFNLSFWEHFTVAGGFAALIALPFAGAGLYQLSTAFDSPDRIRRATLAPILLGCAVLSFGSGYAAWLAAFLIVALVAWRNWETPRRMPSYPWILYCASGLLLLCIAASHPAFDLGSRFFRYVLHFVSVTGALWATPFDAAQMAQNSAFFCGIAVIALAMWAVLDFIIRRPQHGARLQIFAISLVLFGLAACAAVSAGRPGLPDGEFLSSRYTVQPAICLLGLLLYAARARTFLFANVWCLIITSYVFGAVEESQVGRHRPAVYSSIAAAMRGIEKLPDGDIGRTFYWQEDIPAVRRVVGRMQKERLNIFRHDAPQAQGH